MNVKMLAAAPQITGTVAEEVHGALVQRRAFETNEKVLSLMETGSELSKRLAEFVVPPTDAEATQVKKAADAEGYNRNHFEKLELGGPNIPNHNPIPIRPTTSRLLPRVGSRAKEELPSRKRRALRPSSSHLTRPLSTRPSKTRTHRAGARCNSRKTRSVEVRCKV